MKEIKTGDVLDFSEEAIGDLLETFKNTNIRVLGGDFLQFTFSQKYSLITMFEVLEHIENDGLALEKNLAKRP